MLKSLELWAKNAPKKEGNMIKELARAVNANEDDVLNVRYGLQGIVYYFKNKDDLLLIKKKVMTKTNKQKFIYTIVKNG